MKKVKIACVGGRRGKDLFNYCLECKDAELVAVCDFNEEVLNELSFYFKEKGVNVLLIKDFEDLLKLDLDGIVLANYATEHAPFAIKCLKLGINVMSEVLPAINLKQAVELCDAVEESGKIYHYSENYCYLDVAREMKRLCDMGRFGTIEYAEGEYFHDCEPIWHSITYGDKDHWRNHKHAFYYCTHSLGPLIHATKLRPEYVMGFEPPHNDKMKREGALGAPFAIEMLTMSNGAIFRSTHGQSFKNNVWYSLTGSKGYIESARESAYKQGDKDRHNIYTCITSNNENVTPEVDKYTIDNDFKMTEYSSHQLSDKYVVREFIRAIKGEPCDIIDVYEAMDMFLPGIFAYKSVLSGGISQKIPNFRNKEEREKYRKDISCVDETIAGDMVLPSYSKGNPVIEQEVYDKIKEKWEKEVQKNKED